VDLPQLREVVGVTSDDVDVKGYADLISDSKLRGDDPDVVGRELQDLGGDTDYLVAWLPGWLVDEKDVELVGRSDNVVSGQVDYETEKAYLVVVDGDEIWLPKSVIRVYRTAGDVDLEIPLTRLDRFASNGGGDDE
jgi:hypothetical protein